MRTRGRVLIHTHTHAPTHTHTHTHTCVCVCVCVCAQAYTHECCEGRHTYSHAQTHAHCHPPTLRQTPDRNSFTQTHRDYSRAHINTHTHREKHIQAHTHINTSSSFNSVPPCSSAIALAESSRARNDESSCILPCSSPLP